MPKIIKVMLAEDDATMVSLLKTLFKLEGFEALALSADADVPAAARKDSPDILLMDVHLLRQDGLKILDDLRAAPDTVRLPIIMSSGASVKDECMRRGATGFLLKPYMPDELIRLIRQMVQA